MFTSKIKRANIKRRGKIAVKRDAKVLLEDILENIEDIEKFTKGLTKDDLIKNKLKRNAVVRSIEIIGEAAKSIPKDIKEKYPEIEWKEIIGTRDIISHAYFDVDLNVVWDIIKKNLPDLKKRVLEIKQKLENKK